VALRSITLGKKGKDKVLTPSALIPFLRERLARQAPDPDILQPARDSVEPGRKRNNIEYMQLPIFGDDALLHHLPHRIRFDVHDVHVRLIHLLVEVLLKRHPAPPKRMRRLLRREKRRFLWIRDARSDFFPPEVVRFYVRRLVAHDVAVVVRQEAEPAHGPERLEELLALFGCVRERVDRLRTVHEAGVVAEPLLEDLGESGFVRGGLFGGDGGLSHGAAEVGRALEEGEFCCVARHGLRDLDAGCAGADDGDFLVVAVDA